MNHPDSHLGADEVRDPAPVPSGSQEAGRASQPKEVATARPATPPDGPRLFLDAQELYDRAMEMSEFYPPAAAALIRTEWAAARDQMAVALVLCNRQARLEKSQTL